MIFTIYCVNALGIKLRRAKLRWYYTFSNSTMSVNYVREVFLAHERSGLMLTSALSCLPNTQTATPHPWPRPPPVRLPYQRLPSQPTRPPNASTGPRLIPLPSLLDNYQTWWQLDECLRGDWRARADKEPNVPENERPTPAQLSYVLLKLREEIPAFFSGHHSYDLYDPDMLYENQLWRYPWKGRGLLSYRVFLICSRLTLSTLCNSCSVDLLRITKDSEEGSIHARWRVKGRYHWTRRQRVLLEGFSVFQVSSEGLISLHRLGRLEPPRKDPLKHRALDWLAQLGSRKLPQPEL